MGVGTVQSFSYDVPGMRVVLSQAGSMTCWATVYTMMISWKRQMSIPIRDAVDAVNPRYARLYDEGLRATTPQGMASTEFASFLHQAHMTHEPMMNLTIPGWIEKLRRHGLLWVGTLNVVGVGAGLHSRIIEGSHGRGGAADTWFKIIDPAGGRRYNERFDAFLSKYEGAFRSVSGDYFQIRHFL
jgi:papain like cysteine protease AvrRpt2